MTTLQFRPYQSDAIEAIDAELEQVDSTLLVASVGAGKTLMQAGFIQRVIGKFPEARFVCAVHTRELVSQNFNALIRIWPFAPAAINSAALGQRNTRAQILFCSIQSVYSKAQQIGWTDCLIVDEAHLISPKGTTMYRQFIDELRAINPDMRILGMSGTPYRMDTGELTEGDGALFKSVAYNVGVGQLIEEGYLTRPISKGTATTFDVSGVHMRGGDYIAGELERAVNKSHITDAAVDEIIRLGHDRKSWIAFCAGVDHAREVRNAMRERGVSCEMVEGTMDAGTRKRTIEAYCRGEIRCLTNVNVLSIGFDYPAIDLVALMRPTKSPALYVQQVGRGLRLSPGKKDCLVLDFANVVRTLGPVDDVQIKRPGKGSGEAPIRICPDCECINHASARVCIDCGHEFPEPEIKVNAVADDVPILSKGEAESRVVRSRTFLVHPGKDGKPDSVKVNYLCGMKTFPEWVCPAHKGFPKTRADRYWLAHGGQRPFPATPLEWLERQGELAETAEIQVKPNGKYWDIVSHIVGERTASNDNTPPPANDNRRNLEWELEDGIPF
ncbi:DEAD/DEAH box helicase [Sinorhizobium medicae]|nr:DEAD/DEAH box helicase [Sinorhizobium medicae]